VGEDTGVSGKVRLTLLRGRLATGAEMVAVGAPVGNVARRRVDEIGAAGFVLARLVRLRSLSGISRQIDGHAAAVLDVVAVLRRSEAVSRGEIHRDNDSL
jgi:hypothetical protein